MDDRFNNLMMTIVMIFVTIVCLAVFVNVRHYFKQSGVTSNILVDVKYCDGSRDTISIIVEGEGKYVKIANNKKNMAVPELVNFQNKTLVYNVCWFNILDAKKHE